MTKTEKLPTLAELARQVGATFDEDKTRPHMALIGNISEGFVAYGPYVGFEGAASEHDGEETWIMPLWPRYTVVAIVDSMTVMYENASTREASYGIMQKFTAALRRYPRHEDAFIEIRQNGDFEHGSFESIDNRYPDDVWGEE